MNRRRIIRSLVDDPLNRFTHDTVSCSICRQPLDQANAVELDGEPVHQACARSTQAVARVAARRDAVPRDRGQMHLGPVVFMLATLALLAIGVWIAVGGGV